MDPTTMFSIRLLQPFAEPQINTADQEETGDQRNVNQVVHRENLPPEGEIE